MDIIAQAAPIQQGEVDGLVMVEVAFGAADGGGGEDVDGVGEDARGGQEDAELAQGARAVAGLLAQLADGGLARRFAVIDLAGGQFVDVAAHGVAVLLREDDLLFGREREDGDAVVCGYEAVLHLAAVRVAETVAHEADDAVVRDGGVDKPPSPLRHERQYDGYTRGMLGRLSSKVRAAFQIIVLFAVLRLAAGLAMIVLFERDAVAWGGEVTLIVAAAVVVCLLVALAVRRYSPPRGAS